jgi:PadR family transcriptional regulator, regulatory protein PadR
LYGDALRGHLDLLLLSVLEDAPAHGYRIVDELLDRSGGALELAEGTLYPALYRLQRQGLVTSRWARGDGRRRRRVYRLTRRGHRELEAQRSDWVDFARAVDAVALG